MAAGRLCLVYLFICGVCSAPSLSENALPNQQVIIMDDDISSNEMPNTAEEPVEQRSSGSRDSFFKLTKPSEFMDALAAENPYNITTLSPSISTMSTAAELQSDNSSSESFNISLSTPNADAVNNTQLVVDFLGFVTNFFNNIFDNDSTVRNRHIHRTSPSPFSTFSREIPTGVGRNHRQHHHRLSSSASMHSSIYHFTPPSVRFHIPFSSFFWLPKQFFQDAV